jgi:hypothetical protein
MSSTHAFSREPFQGPEAVPTPPPKPVAHSETTRLLCAAAYLDRTFRHVHRTIMVVTLAS